MKALNGKVLLITLMIAGGVAALLGIGQIWFGFMEWHTFVQSLVTIVILGGMAGFLMAVDYDMPASKEKLMLGIVVFLALTMGALIIAQLWWLALPWIDFAKIFGTVLILFVLVSFVLAVKEDFGTSKKLKDENFLD